MQGESPQVLTLGNPLLAAISVQLQGDIMDINEVKQVLAEVRQASDPGKVEDGTRVHIRYERMAGAKVSNRAKVEAGQGAWSAAGHLHGPREPRVGKQGW